MQPNAEPTVTRRHCRQCENTNLQPATWRSLQACWMPVALPMQPRDPLRRECVAGDRTLQRLLRRKICRMCAVGLVKLVDPMRGGHGARRHPWAMHISINRRLKPDCLGRAGNIVCIGILSCTTCPDLKPSLFHLLLAAILQLGAARDISRHARRTPEGHIPQYGRHSLVCPMVFVSFAPSRPQWAGRWSWSSQWSVC